MSDLYGKINASINAQYNSIIAEQNYRMAQIIDAKADYSLQFNNGDLIISGLEVSNS